MAKTIWLVGIGMGNPGHLDHRRLERSKSCDCLIGAQRMLNAFQISPVKSGRQPFRKNSCFCRGSSGVSMCRRGTLRGCRLL